MSGINIGKVVAGGLLAGLVLNVIDFVIGGFLMADDFAANTVRLGLDPATQTTPAVAITWIAMDFVMGLVLVFTYAAIRPRFGPGAERQTRPVERPPTAGRRQSGG